jgi:hypothetical protein
MLSLIKCSGSFILFEFALKETQELPKNDFEAQCHAGEVCVLAFWQSASVGFDDKLSVV